jgi:hypothetical protein
MGKEYDEWEAKEMGSNGIERKKIKRNENKGRNTRCTQWS